MPIGHKGWASIPKCERCEKLQDILQSLADIQNGPLLIKDTKKWNAIMDEAYKILEGG